MPATSIEALHRSVEWAASDVDAQVNHLLQKTALELLLAYHTRLTFIKVFEGSVPTSELQAAVEEPVRHWMGDHVPMGSDLRKRTCFEPGFGPAAEAILKFAGDHGVDLIVMGVERLDPVLAAHIPISDTAYEVVRNATCPVLTVR